MLLGGDEFGRTQGGNNNAWCQDNEISWFDWGLDERQQELLAFTKRLIALRRDHPVFHRRDFLGGDDHGSGLPDVWWFRPDGRRMTQKDWTREDAHALGVFLNGQEIPARTQRGEPIADHSFLILLNAHYEPITFTLPARRFGLRWALELSTADPNAEQAILQARAEVHVESRSVVILRRDF
jgi:glycogen operon protein